MRPPFAHPLIFPFLYHSPSQIELFLKHQLMDCLFITVCMANLGWSGIGTHKELPQRVICDAGTHSLRDILLYRLPPSIQEFFHRLKCSSLDLPAMLVSISRSCNSYSYHKQYFCSQHSVGLPAPTPFTVCAVFPGYAKTYVLFITSIISLSKPTREAARLI
jgi:hypothetical protein